MVEGDTTTSTLTQVFCYFMNYFTILTSLHGVNTLWELRYISYYHLNDANIHSHYHSKNQQLLMHATNQVINMKQTFIYLPIHTKTHDWFYYFCCRHLLMQNVCSLLYHIGSNMIMITFECLSSEYINITTNFSQPSTSNILFNTMYQFI